jgi:hypothetical protein
MLEKLDVTAGLAAKPSPSWPQIWLTAVTRPTIATYQAFVNHASISPRHAYSWLFGSSLISGLLVSLVAFFTRSEPAFGLNLALAILIFALAATLACVIFAGLVHLITRLLRGSGTYQNLITVFAAFNAPLILLAGVLSLAPRSSLVVIALYLYWLFLYSVSIQAVHHVSRLKAIVAVLISLILLGGALLGVGILSIS